MSLCSSRRIDNCGELFFTRAGERLNVDIKPAISRSLIDFTCRKSSGTRYTDTTVRSARPTTSDQVADSGTGFPLAIQQIEDSKIEGTLKVSRLGGATRTEFASCAMTVLQAGGDIPPFGYYDCLFTGSTSLTAPAGAFKLNGVSYKNAASVPLSGGVAREYIDGESPLLATLTSNTFSGTQTAPNFTGDTVHAGLFSMSDNSIISYSDGSGSNGGAVIKPIVGIDDLGLSHVSTGFILENKEDTTGMTPYFYNYCPF